MATKKAQQEKVKLVTRADAANRVVGDLDGQTTLSELVRKADELVVKSGGKSNLATQKDYVRRSLESAASFGLVRLTKPTDTVVEKL